MAGIGGWLDQLAGTHRDRPALISALGAVSYGELRAQSDRVAKALAALGASKGTRVGLLLPNRPEWLACAFGALKLGAIVVPINTLFRAPELTYALRHADVTVLVCAAQFLNHAYIDTLCQICPALDRSQPPLVTAELPALRQVVVLGDRRPRAAVGFEEFIQTGTAVPDEWLAAAEAEVSDCDAAAIFFTSGTTAAPKGVVHTHATMLRSADNVADRLGLNADDRTWGYLPFFFTGGFVSVAMATLGRGGAVLLQEVFDAGSTLQLMHDHGCTVFFAWPHQAEALIAHPRFARGTLRIRKGVGANTGWADRLYPPDHQAVGTWGMTETGPMAASSRYDDPPAVRAGSHGRAMPGMEFCIIDPESGSPLPAGAEGELLARGSSVMAHYYRMSPAQCFDADGYFHTGDLACLDEQGCVHFRGRIKDVIKTAGVNVAAAEIEATVQQHPAVNVACAVGVPHPTRGEEVGLFVVRANESCTAEQLVAFCRERLASYKVPRHVFFCTEADLPVLGSGKLDKQALRARAAEKKSIVDS